jgi:polyisoprenyl-phosphate glycosyltransferase
MTTVPELSVVVPCFNEQECLPEFHRRMTAACDQANVTEYEIIYVNDGSSDRSLEILLDLQRRSSCIKIIDLSRNHGHQIALSAGLAHTRGTQILTIDADLQDPPELLSTMMQKLNKGADVVYARRERRKGETVFKRATAALFYRLLKQMSRTPIALDAGDFLLMRRAVVDVLIAMPETHRYIRGLVGWVGFAQTTISYERDARFSGRTKFPFFHMVAFSLDAITAFATAPLRFVFVLATLSMGVAAALLAWTIYSYLFLNTIRGWPSIMFVFLFFTSVQLLSLAAIGEYVGRIFIQAKHRPLYVIRATFPPVTEKPS